MDGLFAGEQAVFEIVRKTFPEPDMLDIGIGAGRTTVELGPKCRSYLGLDYSDAMVAEARSICGNQFSISHADARDMGQISAGSYDFVLFSFNGIDYVPHADRLDILAEIRRVCRPGGFFAFSTHNLCEVKRDFAPRRARPKALAKSLLQHALNFPLDAKVKQPYAILNDGAHNFGLWTYYVRPDEQIRQLRDAGFGEVRLFGFYSGSEIEAAGPDLFPYYLCRAQ
jgi:ubiquinone/menaquinone biosynthesis C-methylase UbiE